MSGSFYKKCQGRVSSACVAGKLYLVQFNSCEFVFEPFIIILFLFQHKEHLNSENILTKLELAVAHYQREKTIEVYLRTLTITEYCEDNKMRSFHWHNGFVRVFFERLNYSRRLNAHTATVFASSSRTGMCLKRFFYHLFAIEDAILKHHQLLGNHNFKKVHSLDMSLKGAIFVMVRRY